MDTLRISPCKVALTVQSCDSGTELRHGVKVRGKVVQHGDDVRGKGGPFRPFFGNPLHLKEKH